MISIVEGNIKFQPILALTFEKTVDAVKKLGIVVAESGESEPLMTHDGQHIFAFPAGQFLTESQIFNKFKGASVNDNQTI